MGIINLNDFLGKLWVPDGKMLNISITSNYGPYRNNFVFFIFIRFSMLVLLLISINFEFDYGNSGNCFFFVVHYKKI